MKTKLHYLIIALLFGFCLNAQVTGPVTITGTGTGGWNQPGGLVLTTTDGGTTWTATNFEIIGDGAMKFDEAGTWGTTGGFTGANVSPFGFPSGVVTINGGNDIIGGYLRSSGSFSLSNINDFNFQLGRTQTGVSDTFVFTLTPIENGTQISADLSWFELI